MTQPSPRPAPTQPHYVTPTRKVPFSGMHETSCNCGTVVHDIDAEASSAALEPHREIQRKRDAQAADAPSFTGEDR